jgi:Flp pilus assembly pilin Flp
MSRAFVIARTLVERKDGQDLLEYGLLTALIAIVAVASVRSVGNVITTTLWDLIAQIPI